MKHRSSQRLAPIRHIAEGREQAAARKFAESQRRVAEAEAKLSELRGYLQEYQSGRNRVLDPQLLENRRAFINRLREAEAHQAGSVERARHAGKDERERWLKSRRELQVLDRLTTVYRQREHQTDTRHAQKCMDELALHRHQLGHADEH